MNDHKHFALGKQIMDLKRSLLQIGGLPLTAALSVQWLRSLAESVGVRSDTIYTAYRHGSDQARRDRAREWATSNDRSPHRAGRAPRRWGR